MGYLEAVKGKRVCVTGGAGFLGVQLVKLLVDNGAEVFVLDDFSRGENMVDGAEYVMASDATNLGSCEFSFRGFNVRPSAKPVDIVFNLAAYVAGVLYNKDHHVEMFARNMALQTVPLEAAENVGVQQFIQVSSVCVYAPEHQEYADEEDGWRGEPHPANYGYSWAKRMGERMAFASKIPHVTVVRPTNMYGPYDYFDDTAHVIPALIRKALENDTIHLLGNPSNVREFLHTKDAAHGILVAAASGEDRQAYNIHAGEENQYSIMELADLIRRRAGVAHKDITYDDTFGGGDPVRRVNGDKLRELGYEPQIDLFEEGIMEVVEWAKTKKL